MMERVLTIDEIDSLKEKIIVEIPIGVEIIESSTFAGCTNIQQVFIPDSVKEIGEGAFEECTSLKVIQLGKKCKKINNYAFYGCINLKGILSKPLTYIGKSAFQNCKLLQKINISNKCKYIGKNAFSKCNTLKEVTIPDNIEYISSNAFELCESLETITIGTNVTDIGEYAFYKCKNLSSVNLSSTKLIHGFAFAECVNLKSITGDKLKYIASNAFQNCKLLKDVNLIYNKSDDTIIPESTTTRKKTIFDDIDEYDNPRNYNHSYDNFIKEIDEAMDHFNKKEIKEKKFISKSYIKRKNDISNYWNRRYEIEKANGIITKAFKQELIKYILHVLICTEKACNIKRDTDILLKRYDFVSNTKRTYASIAREYDLTPERIRCIVEKLLRQIRGQLAKMGLSELRMGDYIEWIPVDTILIEDDIEFPDINVD